MEFLFFWEEFAFGSASFFEGIVSSSIPIPIPYPLSLNIIDSAFRVPYFIERYFIQPQYNLPTPYAPAHCPSTLCNVLAMRRMLT